MRMFDMGPLGRFRPDQMQAANAIFVLMLIPVFERFVYPALKKLRIPHSPMQRMITGMLLCGLAFVVSGLVQVRIDAFKPDLSVRSGFSNLRVGNFMHRPIDVTVSAPGAGLQPSPLNETLSGLEASEYTRVPSTGLHVHVTLRDGSGEEYDLQNVTLSSGARHSLHVYRRAQSGDVAHVLVVDHSDRHWVDPDDEDVDATEATEDDARFKFVNLSPVPVLVVHGKHPSERVISAAIAPGNATKYAQGVFSSGDVKLLFQESFNNTAVRNLTHTELRADDGADYTVAVLSNGTHVSTARITDVGGNNVSVLWQLPQYIIVSCGEILFSITGLEFAFAEAPQSMKAVVQAGWLLTVAVGSLIVIIVAESSFFKRQRDEFFFFAAMMGVVCLLFVYIASKYRYRSPLYRDPSVTGARGDGSRGGDAETKDTTPLMAQQGSEEAATSFA